jgi:hypothetical protein
MPEWIDRRIKSDPWSKEFVNALDTKTFQDIADMIAEICKARVNGWGKVEG